MRLKLTMFAMLTCLSGGALFLLLRPSPVNDVQYKAAWQPASRHINQVQHIGFGGRVEPANTTLATFVGPRRVIEISLTNGQLSAGAANIVLQHHDRLVLKVQSNMQDIVHIHGYDFSLPLTPNTQAVATLPLRLTGRFEMELHSNKKVFGQLEVFPR